MARMAAAAVGGNVGSTSNSLNNNSISGIASAASQARALSMAQRVANARNAPGGLAANMNNSFVFNGGLANTVAAAAGSLGVPSSSPSVSGGGKDRSRGIDPNNVSATGFNPNTGTTTPTYNNLDSLQNSSANTTVGNVATDAMAGVGGVAPQVQTGSFSPDASIAAEGIFGSEESRGIQPYKKPLINF
jgi:hypothetical protein